MSATLPPRLFETPAHYPYALEGDDCVFIPMDRAAYTRSIFLDRRISPASEQPFTIPLAALAPPAPPPTTGWIFHIAHCGSTLLARALDRPSGGLVLREPLLLRQLGVEAANGTTRPNALAVATALLARRENPALPTLIKANVPVNLLLPALAAADPAAPAIFLHFPLVPYLLAILRSPNHRQWVRFITDELGPGLTALAGPPPADDAPRAAALWLAQIRAFAVAMDQMPNSYSLDAETLFTVPAPVIAAAAALFEQPMDPAETTAIATGPLFATYSKNPAVAFDNAARAAREAELAATLAPELALARQWLTARLGQFPLPARLPRPLLPDQPGRDLL